VLTCPPYMRVNISLAPYTVGAHTSTLNVSPFRTVLGDTTLALPSAY
jgi:hypothetical protein